MFWIIVSIALLIAVIYFKIDKRLFERKKVAHNEKLANSGHDADYINRYKQTEEHWWDIEWNKYMFIAAGVLLVLGIFRINWFYAEPGYNYHIKTLGGSELTSFDMGWTYYGAGEHIPWKQAMSVQSSDATVQDGADKQDIQADSESYETNKVTANLPPENVIFLDQVDADVSSTVRFALPLEREMFLKIVHKYRTPTNLLRTSLIPAYRETLQATGSLMTAEEYYSGDRTRFNNDFQNQMENGIFIVHREEVKKKLTVTTKASANASKGQKQDVYGDDDKVSYRVVKREISPGVFKRKKQSFLRYGISVDEARIMQLIPNEAFGTRMKEKQDASAKRAVAKEKRLEEEENELLAVAKGERQVAETQAKWKVDQMEKTTIAETKKQQAITAANLAKEQAEIDKVTAQTLLDKADIDAKAVKVTADAEAYRRTKILKSDNALQAKLDTEAQIQKYWAQAFADRAVPQYVFGGTGGDGTPVGADSETSNFMKLLTIDAAKNLSYDRSIKKN